MSGPAAGGSAEADGVRLQKVLAGAGLGSRRACEELIVAGRVTVDGDVAVIGRRVDPEHAAVAVDGVPVPTRAGLVYYLLNKPLGVISTAAGHPRSPDGRRPRARPNRASTPSAGSTATPRVCSCSPTTATSPTGSPTRASAWRRSTSPRSTACRRAAALRRLREGVELDDGPDRAGAASRSHPATPTGAALVIVIHEGRNRQVRRMCEAVGHPVPAARAHADRPDRRPRARAGGVARAHRRRGPGAVWSRDRTRPPGSLARR